MPLAELRCAVEEAEVAGDSILMEVWNMSGHALDLCSDEDLQRQKLGHDAQGLYEKKEFQVTSSWPLRYLDCRENTDPSHGGPEAGTAILTLRLKYSCVWTHLGAVGLCLAFLNS